MKKHFLTLAALCGFFIALNVLATTSNYKTFTDGSVLTAAELNNLQTNFSDGDNAILNGDIFTGDMLWYSNSDAIGYTDTGTTKTWHVDTATGDALLAPRRNGAYGLTLSLSSGTLTVQCRNAACSASNPGYVVMNSTTAGQQVTLKVTSGGAINDDAHASASDLTNLEWGVTSSANWARDVPAFLYVVNRGNAALDGSDGNSMFFVARDPGLSTTPSSSNSIGDTGAIAATDDQNAIMILADVTVANYTSLPVELIGAVRMQYLTATNDWTIQTLGQTDGIGESALNKTFATRWLIPGGQMGAASASFILANSGTAPEFTNLEYVCGLDRRGIYDCEVRMEGDGGTDGSGAVASRVILPTTIPSGTMTNYEVQVGVATAQTTITSVHAVSGLFAENTSYVQLRYLDAAAAVTAITNGMFTNGAREIRLKFSYNGFKN